MNDTPRPRRSPTVVLLDAMLSVATAVQSGNLPGRRAADGPRRRTMPVWLLAGVLGTVGGVVVLIGAVLGTSGGLTSLPLPGKAAPAPPVATSVGPALATERVVPSPVPSRGRSASSSPSASASVVSSTPASVPSRSVPVTEAAGVLGADYVAANGSGLLGYRATVTLTAEGAAAAGWRLSVTLPRASLQIGGVVGAEVEQEGAVWTFTPVEETRVVEPGDPVVVTFDVRGATLVDSQPVECRVNERVCGGV